MFSSYFTLLWYASERPQTTNHDFVFDLDAGEDGIDSGGFSVDASECGKCLYFCPNCTLAQMINIRCTDWLTCNQVTGHGSSSELQMRNIAVSLWQLKRIILYSCAVIAAIPICVSSQ